MPKPYRAARWRRPSAALALALLFAWAGARAAPLELYGGLPSLEDVAISPDGTRIAYVRTQGEERLLSVRALGDNRSLGALRVGSIKLRSIGWADDRWLLVLVSSAALPPGALYGPLNEWWQLLAYNVETRESRTLPDEKRLGYMGMNVVTSVPLVRRIDGHTVLFVRGVRVERNARHILVRIDLDADQQSIVRHEAHAYEQDLIDATGAIVAERHYRDDTHEWSFWIRKNGQLEPAASGTAAVDLPSMLGFGPGEDKVLIRQTQGGRFVWKLLSLEDGTLGEPLYDARTPTGPVADRLGLHMIGAYFVGDDARFEFFDPKLQAHWDAITRAFPHCHLRFVSASDDFARIVLRVEGPEQGYGYQLIDLNSHKATPLGEVYDGLGAPFEVRRITYAAADGMKIPAYLTLPRAGARKGLPLVVLPHGGPALRDDAEFDWLSQALAAQGYAVLRPNYRGSALGDAHLSAGFGQFGRKMQTDLSDGVRFLAKEGTIDAQRVCIAGGSYGGYAALAAVSLERGVYRCAASIAGLSDLRVFMKQVDSGHVYADSLTERYWKRFLGVSGAGDWQLDELSPLAHVEAIQVPVLLIHGRDDTVVPAEQSDLMDSALRRAGKPVQYVRLEGEDHWLSRAQTRLRTLQSLVAFLRASNPPD